MFTNLLFFFSLTLWLLAGTGVLHLLPRLGTGGRKISDFFCHAPGLDVVVFYFTVLPLILGPVVAGWLGLLLAVLSQVATLLIWQAIHEACHRDAVQGPRIIKVINKKFGAWRNYTALYVTALVTPVFWFVRMGELIVYPPLVWLVHLPPYKTADWINVSRQKFSGLVGHDLIWCLYCDWMTGVWSLGTEMLRNVESFWCPIRFFCEKKCENCSIDFPDVNNGWVPATATMTEVAETVEKMYTGPEKPQTWFGHPSRKEEKKLTAKPDSIGSDH
jgi:hypothetical protein